MRRLGKIGYFNKMLLSYLLTIILPTVVISLMYYSHVADEKRGEFERASSAHLEQMLEKARMFTDNIDRMAMQISLMPELLEKLYDPFRYDMYDFNQLKESLRNQISANELVHSVYIYFRLNDKVMTTGEGLYRSAEFYDREWIESVRKDPYSGGDFQIRTVQSLWGPTAEIITFRKGVPFTTKEPLGHLAVNVNKDVLFEVLPKVSGTEGMYSFMLDGSTNRVLFAGGGVEEARRFDGLALAEGAGFQVVERGGGKYLITHKASPFNSWIAVEAVPYQVYLDSLKSKQRLILRNAFWVMVIGLALSYSFSVWFYRPWKRIVKSHFVNKYKKGDIAHFISGAIHALIQENEEIKQTMETHKPIIRHRLIYDVLNNHVFDPDTIPGRLQQVGIQFASDHFTAIVAVPDLRETPEEELNQTKLAAFSVVENALSKRFGVAGTFLDHHQFGFILNLPGPDFDARTKDCLKLICEDINRTTLEEWGVPLQFSIGRPCASIADIHHSYADAKRVVNFKALIRKSDVVFMQEPDQGERLEYPMHIQKELVHRIMEGDRGQAQQCVETLLETQVLGKPYPRERLLEMIVMLIGNVMNELVQEGLVIDFGMNLLKINECPNHEELERFILRCVNRLIDSLEDQQEKTSNNVYISKAIEYMENHYRRNISITDIAEYVGLSGSYLSRVFKAETGKPPLEHLSRYRIARGKELLVDFRYSLQEISGLIGYNDAHSFIRFFKKYEGVTPGEYRKRLLDKKPSRPDTL